MTVDRADGKTEAPREHEADVLVLGVALEVAGRRLQNMSGRNSTGRNAPTIILPKQARFWAGRRRG